MDRNGSRLMCVVFSIFIFTVELTNRLQERRENVYVASGASYNSYTITSDLGLTLASNLTISDTCL